MKTLFFLLFLIYNFFLFYIESYYLIIISLILSIILILISKRKFIDYLKFMKKNILFMIFIFLCNLLFTNYLNSLFITTRFLLSINATYIFTSFLTPSDISNSICVLLYPLKIFKVDINKLSLIISIAITFIPILINEGVIIKKSLINKGYKFNLKNVLTRPQIFITTYLNNLFNKIDEIEKALSMKIFD